MTPLAGRQLILKIFRPSLFSAFWIFGFILFFSPDPSAAALLNGALTGSIEGAYIYRDTDQNGVKSSSHEIEQRYNLRYSENLLDSRLGFFSGGINWVDDQTDNSGISNSGNPEQARRYIVKDYNINLSLLPMISPITLYAQKTERENQFDFVSHDTITTYGFGWYYSPLYLPRIGINGSHSTYTSDLNGLFPTSDSDFLTVDTGGKWQEFNLSARYLYNQTHELNDESFWSHGVNLNLNGAVTKALTLGAYANYATRGGTSSGFNFYQENAAGLNLYYLPNKFWDGSLRLDFNESPGMGDFKRYLMGGGLNFHPTGYLDWFNNGQFARYETSASKTDSLFGNSSLIVRPAFGWTLTLGGGLGLTDIEGGGLSSKNSQMLINSALSYNRTLALIRVNGSVAGSLAQNQSTGLGVSKDRILSVSGGIDNTQTQIVHLGVNGSLTSINREVTAESNDQKETRFSATADSHFFRNFFFSNDSLFLDGTLTWLDITGYGVEGGKTLSEDFHGTYQFLGMFTLLGTYSHISYPNGLYGGDANIASIDFTGTVRPWDNGNLAFGLKELVDDREDQYTQKTFEGQTKLSHQLGRLMLSTEFNYLRNDTGPMVTTSQQFMVRAIRPF